jgi:hypothetical protein
MASDTSLFATTPPKRCETWLTSSSAAVIW